MILQRILRPGDIESIDHFPQGEHGEIRAVGLGSLQRHIAVDQADPVLLEPIMKVSVITPDDYLGDVIGDLNSRRGQIQGMDARHGVQQVIAFVPLSEMFGYATDLRSKTQGRGQYTMEPSHYVEVPKSIAEKIISSRTKGE